MKFAEQNRERDPEENSINLHKGPLSFDHILSVEEEK